MVAEHPANHLNNETSPYLLQHAHNPVEWYPWGDAALARAKAENKPILLSIGYSACHWCHVMAHESFENAEIARLMNADFINIKVDREERPDLDAIYMEAVQSITGSGGWPLTVFLTPEAKPFYGGTYFPPEDRSGLPGFARVLKTVAEAYQKRRAEVEQATAQIAAALERVAPTEKPAAPVDESLSTAYLALQTDFDSLNGGFGHAPKFPQPLVLEYLLKYHHRTRDPEALAMVVKTLEKMAAGGMYDQVGGGFHRYSTDARWLVPHFEKMLYDNALLSRVYLHAWLVTGRPLFRRIAEETLEYLLRDMASPAGAFYSSQDADSEGEEGRYYVWTPAEILQTLGPETGRAVNAYYAVTPGGNFAGRNILHVPEQSPPTGFAVTPNIQAALLAQREKRVHPGTDDKVLASWNGLALAALAEAGGAFGRADYLAAAEKNAAFLLNSLAADGYLKHVYAGAAAKVEGYLEDYACVIEGLLAVQPATSTMAWLEQAARLAETLIDLFWSQPEGTFYDTGARHPSLFIRPRSAQDGAVPSGASLATLVLLKLARLTGDQRAEQIAKTSLQSMQTTAARYPTGFANWLCAADLDSSKPQEIVIAGPRGDPKTIALARVVFNSWLPNAVFAAFDPQLALKAPAIPLFTGKIMLNDQPTAYVCQNYACRAPLTDPARLKEMLTNQKGG